MGPGLAVFACRARDTEPRVLISKFTMSGSNSLPTFVRQPIGTAPINMHYTAIHIAAMHVFVTLLNSPKMDSPFNVQSENKKSNNTYTILHSS